MELISNFLITMACLFYYYLYQLLPVGHRVDWSALKEELATVPSRIRNEAIDLYSKCCPRRDLRVLWCCVNIEQASQNGDYNRLDKLFDRYPQGVHFPFCSLPILDSLPMELMQRRLDEWDVVGTLYYGEEEDKAMYDSYFMQSEEQSYYDLFASRGWWSASGDDQTVTGGHCFRALFASRAARTAKAFPRADKKHLIQYYNWLMKFILQVHFTKMCVAFLTN